MEKHEKLQHLTDEEIQEIIELYSDPSIKTTEIIQAYNLDVQPSALLRIFPPTKTDEVCIYCGNPLYHKVPSRSASSYEREHPDKFCLVCGHTEYVKSSYGLMKQCQCKECKARAKIKKQQELDRLRREKEEKKAKIQEVYGIEHDRIKFDDMDLDDQIALWYLILNNQAHSSTKTLPTDDEACVEYIKELLATGALSVDPTSDPDAFSQENFPYKARVTQINCLINVEFTVEELTALNNNEYFINTWTYDALMDSYKDVLCNDLLEQYNSLLEERSFSLHYSAETKQKFIDQLDRFAYTQMRRICYYVAKNLTDQVTTRKLPRYMANNKSLSDVVSWCNHAYENDWDVAYSNPYYLTSKLMFFVKHILNKDIDILDDIANAENLESWPEAEDNYRTVIK